MKNQVFMGENSKKVSLLLMLHTKKKIRNTKTIPHKISYINSYFFIDIE